VNVNSKTNGILKYFASGGQGLFLLISCKRKQKKQAFLRWCLKARHLADREWGVGATHFLKKPPLDPTKTFYCFHRLQRKGIRQTILLFDPGP
jgi:hypothetical protein